MLWPQRGCAMDSLDATQLSQLRALLDQRRVALELVLGAPAGARDLPVEEVETSPADKATVRLLNDLALEAVGHNAAMLTAVRHALAKFDDGSFGLCEMCGNDIPFSRLEARPEATLCIACQTRAEQRLAHG
jgi:DnaK suppressor protein